MTNPLKKYTAVILMLSIVSVSACQSQRFTPTDYTGRQLIFGSGGGFSGQVIQYILLENGQLFSSNTLTKESKEIKKLTKKETKKLFTKATQVGLDKMNFNHPGNMYYFVRLKEGSTIHEVTWGSNEHQAPQSIQDFYQVLSTIIANNK